jgi:hypothetical protein
VIAGGFSFMNGLTSTREGVDRKSRRGKDDKRTTTHKMQR